MRSNLAVLEEQSRRGFGDEDEAEARRETFPQRRLDAGAEDTFEILAVVMLLMLDRRVGGLGRKQILLPSMKMIAATLVMGAIVWGVKVSPLYPHGVGRGVWSVQLALLLVLGTAVYLGASHLLGLDTFRQLISSRRRT